MQKQLVLKAFEIKKNGRQLNYLIGQPISSYKITAFLQKKGYVVKNLVHNQRTVTATLKKDKRYFFKLGTSEGISEMVKNEIDWCKKINPFLSESEALVCPKIYEDGEFDKNRIYYIGEYFIGQTMVIEKDFNLIVSATEMIKNLNIAQKDDEDHRKFFLKKTKGWFEVLPEELVNKYKLEKMMNFILENHNSLKRENNHGDFAPGHLFKLSENKLAVIDWERARSYGVENYDIGYFLQRIFSVMKSENQAKKLLHRLITKGYSSKTLKIILSSRAIGGFLDVYGLGFSDYKYASRFKEWVESI